MIFIRKARERLLLTVLLLVMLCFAGSVQAAAKTVNAVREAQTVSGGKWVSTKKGKKYRYAEGGYAKSTWLNVGGHIYRIKKNGVRATGWFTVSGKKFYASKTGKVYIKRWLKKGSSRYYLQSTGIRAQSKWVTIDGKKYYFLKSGKMAKDRMISWKGKHYYVDKSGVRAGSGWVEHKGKKYFCDKKGVRIEGKWVLLQGELYYFGDDGAMAVNTWVDNMFYVGADGARLKNTYIDGYYLDANGKKIWFTQDYIFVGDSRMVGMKAAVTDNMVHYIAEVGMGYDWLMATGGPELEGCLTFRPNVTVVLALGVNDPDHADKYIAYYQQLIQKYPATKFYALSVNPFDEEAAQAHGFKLTNKHVTGFNKKLKAAFTEPMYVNSYKFLKQDGNLDTVDGVHYTKATYRLLYNFIMTSIGGVGTSIGGMGTGIGSTPGPV